MVTTRQRLLVLLVGLIRRSLLVTAEPIWLDTPVHVVAGRVDHAISGTLKTELEDCIRL